LLRVNNIYKKVFTFDDQLTFAKLSGDYNPLHLDEVLARRLLFGSPIVHGVHLLLWSLDCWLNNSSQLIEFKSIKASFLKPLNVGEKVSLSWESNNENSVRMKLIADNVILSIFEFKWHQSEEQNLGNIKKHYPKKIKPVIVKASEIENKSGHLNYYLNSETTSMMFPYLIKYFSTIQISIILATTRLVGTKCPGLNSIYSELNLVFNRIKKVTTLKYFVEKFDKRFSIVNMKLLGHGFDGSIKAFLRPERKKQNTYKQIKKEVEKGEFHNQRALIIGGSRGLGEVTAKLLAAGSADVKLTYYKGKDDADRIVKEINSNGGSSDFFQYNVICPDEDLFYRELNNWSPTHLYFFATPFIFSGTKGVLSPNLFDKFGEYYVSGFIKIMNMVKPLGLKSVFYPSTVAIDELPYNMAEYVSAKIAGEMICKYYEKNNINIYRPRLPRLDTDQTVNLFHIQNKNPVPVQLKHLRFLRDGVH